MAKDTFIGSIDRDGIIWSQGFGQQKDVAIGVDNQAFSELRADRDDCYAKAEKFLEEQYLIAEGKLQPRQRPKTEAQIKKEQEDINGQIFQALSLLTDKLENLEKEKKSNKVEVTT